MSLLIAFSIALTGIQAADGPAAGTTAEYAVHGAAEEDKTAVSKVRLSVIGPAEGGGIEWQMEALLSADKSFSIRAVSDRVPMTTPEGPGHFLRYIFRDTRGKVTEYRDARSGKALLPRFNFIANFVPACEQPVPMQEGFAVSGRYLGHIALLKNVTGSKPPVAWTPDIVMSLDPDLMIGVLWSVKDDGTGVKADDDFKYLDFTEKDYDDIIAAGCNYFGAPPSKDRPILIDKPAFFNLMPSFPEDFYRANYYGIDMMTDEPAIRLGLQSKLISDLSHPAQVADLLVTRLKGMYGHDGTPFRVHNAVKAQTSPGVLDLRIDDIPTWETMYESAFYTMAGGAGGIVHEGRYTPDAFGWQHITLFGSSIQLSADEILRCHYAVMRGAGRAFGRDWGTSIYGQCNPALRLPALTLAYDLGARWLWFWSADHGHHVPHAEKLRLLRDFQEYVKTHPRRPRDELRRAARTAVALPWGYVLAFDNLYGLGTLPLDQMNGSGVPFRQVVMAAVWEGVKCVTRGESFDFTVDHPGLDGLGYERIVRVDETATVRLWPTPATPAAAPSMKANIETRPAESTAAVQPGSYVLPCMSLHGRQMKIDGNLADWPSQRVSLPDQRFTSAGQWSGPEDLSSAIALGYDEERLYFAATVRDDIHAQTESGWRLWDGDCVQIAIDPLNTRTPGPYTSHQHEFGFALTASGKVSSWRWNGAGSGGPGELRNVRVEILRDESAHTTTYEAAIPIHELRPLAPGVDRYAGICLLLADDDGPAAGGEAAIHRDGYIETSPGAMTAGKHHDQFGSIEFLPPASAPATGVVRSDWATVLPLNFAVRSGDAIEWLLRHASATEKPPRLELRTELATLLPATPASVVDWVVLPTEKPTGSRRVGVKVEADPGRYRLSLSVIGPNQEKLASEEQIIFISPARR